MPLTGRRLGGSPVLRLASHGVAPSRCFLCRALFCCSTSPSSSSRVDLPTLRAEGLTLSPPSNHHRIVQTISSEVSFGTLRCSEMPVSVECSHSMELCSVLLTSQPLLSLDTGPLFSCCCLCTSAPYSRVTPQDICSLPWYLQVPTSALLISSLDLYVLFW